jgi:hypothetical protein
LNPALKRRIRVRKDVTKIESSENYSWKNKAKDKLEWNLILEEAMNSEENRAIEVLKQSQNCK